MRRIPKIMLEIIFLPLGLAFNGEMGIRLTSLPSTELLLLLLLMKAAA